MGKAERSKYREALELLKPFIEEEIDFDNLMTEIAFERSYTVRVVLEGPVGADSPEEAQRLAIERLEDLDVVDCQCTEVPE